MTPRYSFVYVDKTDNLTRYRKDSVHCYQKVIATKGTRL